jgi:hypothetical protein
VAHLVCPPTTNDFLNSVCAIASANADWHAITVPSDDLGPTPQMYAKLAVAVLNGDSSACDDSQITTFIMAGSHANAAAANGMCTAYFATRQHDGWFEVSDPATADTIRIEMAQ